MTKNGNIVKWVEDDFKRLGIKIESIEAVVIFGASDYDTPTAIATYERAVATLLDRSQGYIFDEIVLGVGNDLLNSDDSLI